jgi:hypothetical protein
MDQDTACNVNVAINGRGLWAGVLADVLIGRLGRP